MQAQLTEAMQKLAEAPREAPAPAPAPAPPPAPAESPRSPRSQGDIEREARDQEEIQHLREETRALRAENTDLRRQVSDLEEQLRHAHDEVAVHTAKGGPRGKRRASVVVKSAVPAGPVEEGTLMAQLVRSCLRCCVFQAPGFCGLFSRATRHADLPSTPAARGLQQESEQRAVALLSRNTVLEEELENYKVATELPAACLLAAASG